MNDYLFIHSIQVFFLPNDCYKIFFTVDNPNVKREYETV